MKDAADGALKGILAYTDEPLVSVDFNHDPHSSTYDATMTKVIDGTLVKVCAWYDNEWGFSNRMLDTTLALVEGALRSAAMSILRMTDLDLRGKRVLIREDLNVPVQDGVVTQRRAHPRVAADDPGARTDAGAARAGDVAPRPARGGRVRRGVLAGAGRAAAVRAARLQGALREGLARRRRVRAGRGRAAARTCASTRARRRTRKIWRRKHGRAVRRLRDGCVRHRASRRGEHARRGALRARSPAPARC